LALIMDSRCGGTGQTSCDPLAPGLSKASPFPQVTGTHRVFPVDWARPAGCKVKRCPAHTPGCAHACTRVHTCTHMHTQCTHTCTHTRPHRCTHTHPHNVHAHLHTCAHAHTPTQVHPVRACTHKHTRVHTHTHISIPTHVHTCTHTHTHTCASFPCMPGFAMGRKKVFGFPEPSLSL
jgi:hypothetical protein